ncbi:uncharacterized protein LOC141600656 [Silene latifolia]|uniref:uncharacterized protein LOC141600656 n=1 Tax=Silene latifolia TaxID=37657 RepID=UPI003D7771EC
MSLIEDFTPLPNDVDRVYWEFGKADGYTAKSFVDAFYSLKYEDVERKQWFTLIWKNLAPPRYEIILWAILWKRVNTKDRILKWKTLYWDEMTCVFCRDVLETPNHLFLHCRFSWKLWMDCCAEWSINWICPMEIEDAFIWWNDSPFSDFERRIWEAMFVAIVTLIWEVRNECIFENKAPNWLCMTDKVVLRVGMWSKAWKDKMPYSLEDWMNNWKTLRSWRG